MEQISAIAAWILGIVVCLTAVGVGWALIRGSYTKARMEALRDSLNDTDKALEREKSKTNELVLRVQHLESENETLKSLVLQRAEFEQINQAISVHNQQATDNWNALSLAMKGYYEAIVANQATIVAKLEGGDNA